MENPYNSFTSHEERVMQPICRMKGLHAGNEGRTTNLEDLSSYEDDYSSLRATFALKGEEPEHASL